MNLMRLFILCFGLTFYSANLYIRRRLMQDILMNDEIKLDDNFKLSFMTDIAKGMEYLHKSHLHSYGNLKSSNCLVDGRWIVKVSRLFIVSVNNSLRNCYVNVYTVLYRVFNTNSLATIVMIRPDYC